MRKEDKRKYKNIVLMMTLLAISITFFQSSVKIKSIISADIAKAADPIILHGVNWSGLEYRGTHELTLQKLTDIKNQWNIKILRLPFNKADYLSDCNGCLYDSNKSYRQAMRDIVSDANSLGITVILDLQWLCSDQSAYPILPIPDSGAINMWGQISQEPLYKNNPLIWFDIWNEPHIGAGSSCGMSESNITFIDWKNRANEIVTEIRKYADNNVLVGGMDYAYDLSPWRGNYLTQSNVIYSSHPYGPSTKGSGAYQFDEKIGGVVSDGKPVFLGEIGADWNKTEDQDWFNNYALPWVDGIGRGSGIPTTPIGWTAWSMADSPLLTAGDYTTPTVFGQAVKNKLNAISANPIPPTPASVPINLSPIGNVDGADTTHVTGWTYDQDNGTNPINIHVYIDGIPTANVVANLPRPDLVTAGVAPDPNHGFDYTLPALTDGTHTINVYAINTPTGNNPELPGSPKTITIGTPTLSNGPFTATYYTSRSSIKFNRRIFSRTDNDINFDWGNSSPDPMLPIDNFAVRWTGNINFPESATYNFTAITDDGMRVWIDGVLILNKWFNQYIATYTFSRSLTKGNHTIKVEYYEKTNTAVAKLSWAKG